jgi:amino acid adenylation domain-containing protein/non-ribosomal peptide synthase protein (TIGR01720 family)
VWQRAWLSGERLREQEEYWSEQLRGAPELLELPTDRPRPAAPSHLGGVVGFTLGAELVRAVKELGRRQGTTLYMTLLAGFQALLYRYSGQGDVVVGSPIAGRGRAELEGLIGYFVNTLALRSRMNVRTSVAELLQGVRETTLGAYAHQELPFERVVELLRPERSLSHHPVFQVWFVLQNAPAEPLRLGDLQIEPQVVDEEVVKFDLMLSAEEVGAELRCRLRYARDLFDEGTARRLVASFQRLLEAMARDDGQRLIELPVMGEAERRRIVLEWNRPERESRGCVHEEFATRASAQPEAVALACDGREMTYGELERLSNQLARHLMGVGVRAESRVGLCVERSFDLVVGLLGVMKAGGAYVPLDPEQPPERLRSLLADAAAEVVVTTEAWRSRVGAAAAVVVSLDGDGAVIAKESSEAAGAPMDPANLAYVIYTSGSTGQPKGVGIEHRQLVSYTYGVCERMGLREGSTYASLSTIAADLGHTALFAGLLGGGRVRLFPDPGDVQAVSAGLREVDCLKVTPSQLRALQAALPEADLMPRRLLVLGGESSSREWLSRARRRAPACAVMNHYGPTETTVGALSHWVEEDEERVPLGRPLPHSRVYVLDEAGQPAPVGASGEICIGGAGVGRGYWGRPELTAARFVPDPYGAPGSRLYRTGDLGRYREGGAIEFLGRADQQVKLRGYRIEPGEIESVLAEHAEVEQAAVVLREERLVAYVVPSAASACAEGEWSARLRSFLGGRLPAPMVPASYVALPALPLTANGKLDRRALPAPPSDVVSRGGVARSAAEESLLQIWRQVLGREELGIEDNFFALGGDSIQSIQVVARARQQGWMLTTRQLFEHQTIAALAAVARRAGRAADEKAPLGPAPLTPIQRTFFGWGLAHPHHYNQALLLDVKEGVERGRLEQSLRQVWGRHAALRLRFSRDGEGRWQQRQCGDEAAALEYGHEVVGSAAELAERVAAVQGSLDLERGPLARAVHFDLGASGQRLLLVIHHLAVDGVSWRILLSELEQSYRGEELPPVGTSYVSWARLLEQDAASAATEAEGGYWSSVLAAATPWAPPASEARANTVRESRTVEVALSEAQTRALLEQAPAAYRTQINDLLLAALGEALCEWSGQASVLVDVEGHGRQEVFPEVDLSRTVGWFTTLYPVALEKREGEGKGELLRRITDQLRQLPRQGMGWGLRGQASPAPVRFNYLGQLDGLVGEGRLLVLASEGSGASQHPDDERPYALDVVAQVLAARLRTRFVCGPHLPPVEELADLFQRTLQALIAHCCQAQTGGYTASDFPRAALTGDELEGLLGSERGIEDVYTLSPLQQGLLFHTLYAPQAAAYFEQISCRMEGPLDVGRFRAAWDRVIERHPVLRTGFEWEGLSHPVQVVRRRAAWDWKEEDWSACDEHEVPSRLEVLLEDDRRQGVDLRRGPLMRVRLLKLGSHLHQLLWSNHHLILDGWSRALLVDELFTLYEAGGEEGPVGLPTARPFRRYIDWLAEQDLAEADAFWRQELAGFTAPTPLGIDRRARRPAQSYGCQRLHIDRGIRRQLEEMGRREQVTLNTVLQAAWALLLSRYAGEHDVVFGATAAGRPPDMAAQSGTMLGLFINTLPVRVRVPPRARLGPWLRELQARQAAAREFDFISLADIQARSDLAPGAPLFETLLVVENYPVGEALRRRVWAELAVTRVEHVHHTHYPLMLTALPLDELTLECQHDESRLAAADVHLLLRHLQRLMAAMAAGGDARLHELQLLDEEEHAAVLAASAPRATADSPLCVHHAFEERAAIAPEAVAIECNGQQVTYAALDGRANQLAHCLRGLGVGPDVRVGICLAPSIELVVAVLGVLKAGGAYLPFDIESPRERLAYMLADAGAAVVVTEEALRERLPAGGHVVVCLDGASDQVTAPAATSTGLVVDPDTLAYVIYTSGSTGHPKGVAVSHASVARLFDRTQPLFHFSPSDVWTLFHSIAFDFSVWEIFGALVHGGRLVVVPKAISRLPELFYRLLVERGVTVLNQTPSAFAQLMEMAPALASNPGWRLRVVVFGGEALDFSALRPWVSAHGLENPALVNMYGITETTVHVTHHAVDADTIFDSGVSAIGTPIADLDVYVLGPDGGLVATGVPGEMYVGGPGLARGYLGRPDLTAERFVPHPYSYRPGARLYRTGDLARRRADGRLEYLGRIDQQVKVRGFRIELGEVAAALREVEGVRNVAVCAQRSSSGDPRLVAYIVPAGPQTVSLAGLQQAAARRLPPYMLPAAYCFLEALPLTVNGKLDVQALPAVDGARPALEREYVGPRTETESRIASLWCEVLGLDRVGVVDDFFELGGSSLTATRLVGRLRKLFGGGLALRQLFEARTVATMADLIDRPNPPAAPAEPELKALPRPAFARPAPGPQRA